MKIVAYYRVSTKKQEDSGLGLKAQKAAVADYARQVGGEIIAEYTEVETGKSSTRPKLTEALGHAKLGRATLVIAKLDRLARNVYFTAKLMEEGVDFVACDNPHANRFTIHILAAVAENEAHAISKRTKEALAQTKAKGQLLGWARPGHCNGDESKRGWKKAIQVAAEVRTQRTDAAYASILPRMKQWAEEGVSYREIADKLNAENLLTTSGKPFIGSTVFRILKRAAEKVA